MKSNIIIQAILACTITFYGITPAFAADLDGQHRPFNQMQGDCKNYAIPLETEFSLWKKEAIKLNAAEKADNASNLALNTKTAIQLHPQEKITFIAAPEKLFNPQTKSFAGIISFTVPQDGSYRISAGSKVWFDVINAKTAKRVSSTEFEMQTQCPSIFKTVAFNLKANQQYYLQISSSKEQAQNFLLSNDSNAEDTN